MCFLYDNVNVSKVIFRSEVQFHQGVQYVQPLGILLMVEYNCHAMVWTFGQYPNQYIHKIGLNHSKTIQCIQKLLTVSLQIIMKVVMQVFNITDQLLPLSWVPNSHSKGIHHICSQTLLCCMQTLWWCHLEYAMDLILQWKIWIHKRIINVML